MQAIISKRNNERRINWKMSKMMRIIKDKLQGKRVIIAPPCRKVSQKEFRKQLDYLQRHRGHWTSEESKRYETPEDIMLDRHFRKLESKQLG